MQQLQQFFLYIHLDHIHLRSNRQIDTQYLSFLWEDNFYFSNCYNSINIHNFTITLNNTLILPVLKTQQRLSSIRLQNWQKHMILFQHQIDISELNSKNSTRKKNQIRQGEILEFTISMYTKQEIRINTFTNESLLQHFLIIENITTNEETRDAGPSFYKIQYSEGQIVIPVVNSAAIIPLPTTIKFYHYKNGKLLSQSPLYQTHSIKSAQFRAGMIIKEDKGYDLDVNLLWASNFCKHKKQANAFLQAHDIILSDIQIKFQPKQGLKVDLRPEQVTGIKLKVLSGNKTFELNGDIDPLKTTRFARIIYFIVKSDEQQFSICLQKGPRIVAKTTFGADELIGYFPNMLKRKLFDPYSGKAVATIKFRGEKAKNLSLPQNNLFWKDISQKKVQALMLQFSQISLFAAPAPCGIIIKTEQSQVFVPDVLDINVFQLQSEFPQPVTLSMKEEGRIYFKLVPSDTTNQQQFFGMASINPKDLKLGKAPISVVFYKQKEFICQCRMIINKVMPWPFIKGIFQPESLIGNGIKTMNLSVMLKNIELTSYYWSYVYQGKGDIYCIVEVNRLKKVLILQRVNMTEKLFFINAAGSDLLNFVVDYKQSFKIKFTLLASDGGIEEEIYGTVQKRIKLQDMSDGPLQFTKLSISNSYYIQVGYLQFQIQKGLIGQFKKSPLKKQLNLVKQNLDKINKSIENVQKHLSPKNKKKQYDGRKRYESLVLPQIKDPKQERLKKIARALQMKQAKKKSNHSYLDSLQLDQIQAIRKSTNNNTRPKSQSLKEMPIEREVQSKPLPLTVQEQVYSKNQAEDEYIHSKRSQINLDFPSNQFEQNQFIK